MVRIRNESGRVESEWDPPEVEGDVYAGCAYCGAPVLISHIVNRAVAEALIHVTVTLQEGARVERVIASVDRVISELLEVARTDADETAIARAMMDLRLGDHDEPKVRAKKRKRN